MPSGYNTFWSDDFPSRWNFGNSTAELHQKVIQFFLEDFWYIAIACLALLGQTNLCTPAVGHCSQSGPDWLWKVMPVFTSASFDPLTDLSPANHSWKDFGTLSLNVSLHFFSGFNLSIFFLLPLFGWYLHLTWLLNNLLKLLFLLQHLFIEVNYGKFFTNRDDPAWWVERSRPHTFILCLSAFEHPLPVKVGLSMNILGMVELTSSFPEHSI